MRLSAALCVAVWLVQTSAADSQALPEATERNARASIVLVRPPSGTRATAGSGFLYRRDSEGGFILTSEFCVGASNTVDLVFNSGTPQERVLEGAVVGVDPGRALATIRVEDPDLPQPLAMAPKTDLKETEFIFLAGHPGADFLPAPPTGLVFLKSSVSSLRKNDQGRIVAIQFAGDVSVGHAGGPLLDKGGRVSGITLGKMKGTQTAFAVAVEEVKEFLAGNWAEIAFLMTSDKGGKAKMDVTVLFSNPQGTMRAASLAWCRKDAVKDPREPLPPDKNGNWGKSYSVAKEVPLKLSEDKGEASIEMDLQDRGGIPNEIVFQFKLTDGGGTTTWTAPASGSVEFSMRVARSIKNPSGVRHIRPIRVTARKVALTPMTTAGVFRETGRLKRSSVLGDVHLSPDGAEILALDFSAGALLRVETASMTLAAEATLPAGVCSLAISPDWKTAWLAFRIPVDLDGKRFTMRGAIRRCKLPELKLDAPIELEGTIREIVVTDAGLLAVSPDHGGLFVYDPAKRAELARGDSGLNLVLHPSQQWVYATHGPPFVPLALPFAEAIKGTKASWTCPCKGADQAGRAAISDDGKWLLLSNGMAGKISGAKGVDFVENSSFEPAFDITIPRGSSTFFTSTSVGTVREYVLGEWKIAKEVTVGAPLLGMRVDPAAKRLYGIAVSEAIGADTWRRKCLVGDLVSISLGEPK